MIYLNGVDPNNIDHVIVMDNTTTIGIMKLDFKLFDCENIGVWYNRVENLLIHYAENNGLNPATMNAKAIRFLQM